MARSFSARPSRRGFTLVELLVVVAILVALASIIVPMLGGQEKAAQISVESASSKEVYTTLNYYKIKNEYYPDYFDSLLADGGTTPYSKAPRDLFDGKLKLKTVALTDTPGALYLTSLNNAGLKNVMWHDESVTQPSSSGTKPHAWIAGDFACTINSASPDGLIALNEILPQGLAANQMLVVVGVGPQCRAVGTTISDTPLSPQMDHRDRYRRYLAIFIANGTGAAAQLKCVVNHQLETVDQQLNNYADEKSQN